MANSSTTTATAKPRVTWAQREEAKFLGLSLPFPCTRAMAGVMIREARAALASTRTVVHA